MLPCALQHYQHYHTQEYNNLYQDFHSLRKASGSQLGVNLSPRKHLATTGGSFGCHKGKRVTLSSSVQRLGMLLSTLQGTDSPQNNYLVQNVTGTKIEKPCIASTPPSHQEFKILADIMKTEPAKGHGQSHHTVSSSIPPPLCLLPPSLGSSLPPSHLLGASDSAPLLCKVASSSEILTSSNILKLRILSYAPRN